MRVLLVAMTVLALAACEGAVFEPGDYTAPEAIIDDPNAPRVLAFSCDATAVNASVPVECTIQATHPAGEAVTCTLDRGDGRPAIELGDCQVPRNATVRFAEPGRTTLTLTVTDGEGRSSTRSVIIDVTGKPNAPPVLSGFTATPPTGATPLKTTLTWTATDAEGGAMRCDVDVDADGTPEFRELDCAVGRQAIEVRGLGLHNVKLTATDDFDSTSEATLTVEVLEPRGDVRVSRVDFGQSVVKADLPLVEGKPALLRVSVLANEAGIAVEAKVEATKGGASLGVKPLTAPATVPVSEDLADLNKQFRVVLPPEWVTPGVSLAVRVDPSNALPETDETNNDVVLTPTVARGHVLHLTSVPVVQNGLTGTVRDARAAVTSVWPVRDVEVKTRAPYTSSQVLSGFDTGAWGGLLDELAQVRAADGSQRNYYGWLKVNYGSGIAGIGYIGQPTAIGRDDSLSTAAHELGHNFGRPHAPCGGVAGADPSYPYAGARIGSQGWDGTRILSPNSYVDLMSYCEPEWISDYTYLKAQQFMNGKQSFDPAAVLPDVRWTDAALVSGRLLPTGELRWAPIQRIRAAVTPVRAEDAVVVLATRDGGEVRVPVSLDEMAEGDERHFVAVVPWPGALAGVSLELGGRVVGRRMANETSVAPTASVTRVDARTVRVRWTGGAYAAIAHLGDERTTLTLGLTGGDVLLRVDGLDGGELEVSLSDGVASSRLAVPMP